MGMHAAAGAPDPSGSSVPPVGPVRILIVDDHTTFAELLAGALDREQDLLCVGTAKTAAAGVELAAAVQPDLIMMDFHLPDENGVDAAARILAANPGTRIVILTGDPTMEALERAASLGVCGFLPKDGSLSTMLDTIRTCRVGGFIVHPSLVVQLATQRRAPRPAPPTVSLTKRELEVLALMAKGGDVRVNARILGISESTCRWHVKSILAKLDAHSQLEAVVMARKMGLVRDGDQA